MCVIKAECSNRRVHFKAMESDRLLLYKSQLLMMSRALKPNMCSKLSRQSQLIVRNQEYFQVEHLVVIGSPADDIPIYLLNEGIKRITVLTRDFSVYRYYSKLPAEIKQKLTLTFAPVLQGDFSERFDGVLLYLDKSKPLMDLWLQMVLHGLPREAPVWLVGRNDEGIKSWKKRLTNYFSTVTHLDSAKHCVLLKGSEAVKKIIPFVFDSWFEVFFCSL